MTSVPCNGCTACCKDDLIVLHPEEGDKPETYKTMTLSTPVGEILALARQDNGWCIYLTEGGCSIHDRAPIICRQFDCRRAFLKFGSRNSRRMLIAKGMASKEVMDAGRKRLDTLPEWER